MRNFIAMLMILGLVGFAVAQDLDAPTSGVAVEATNDAPPVSIFDQLLDRLTAETDSAISRTRDAGWWGYRWNSLRSDSPWLAAWLQESRGIGWAYGANMDLLETEQMTAAEYAEFVSETRNSASRLLSAGLN